METAQKSCVPSQQKASSNTKVGEEKWRRVAKITLQGRVGHACLSVGFMFIDTKGQLE